jgi:hypothetical protein
MCTSWCASMCEQLIWICRVLGLGRLDGGAAGPGRKSLITAVRTMFIYVQMRRVDHKHHHGDLPITHKLTSPSHCRRGSPFDVSSSRAGYGAHVRVPERPFWRQAGERAQLLRVPG